jgi:hypothetical protein
LNHLTRTAKAVQAFEAPDGLSANTQGSVQILPNSNIFVNWGEAGAVTEFSNEGDVLFHSYLDSAPQGALVHSYRGFKFNWTGVPAEEPAIVALKSSARATFDIYVSWNGDTEAATWRFYTQVGKDDQEILLLGEVERKGFETHARFHIASSIANVIIFAEAIDSGNKVLVRTRSVSVCSNTNLPPCSPSFIIQL